MLRKTKQGLERLVDGAWVPATDGNAPQEVAVALEEEIRSMAEEQVSVNGQPPKGSQERVAEAEALDADAIPDVPGLVSSEGVRSTAGQKRLAKLRGRARPRGQSTVSVRMPKGKEILVGSGAASVEGPDAQQSRVSVGQRRIVLKDVPVLLEKRPKWVQELFEAHFRSELALTLRHIPMGKSGKNRMKLSRADYAIGWLVMFDKAREDPGILRLRPSGA